MCGWSMVKVLQLVAGCVLRQHEIELLWKEQSCWRRGWKPVVVVGVSGASGDEGSDVVVFVWLIWQWKTWERKLCYEGFHNWWWMSLWFITRGREKLAGEESSHIFSSFSFWFLCSNVFNFFLIILFFLEKDNVLT